MCAKTKTFLSFKKKVDEAKCNEYHFELYRWITHRFERSRNKNIQRNICRTAGYWWVVLRENCMSAKNRASSVTSYCSEHKKKNARQTAVWVRQFAVFWQWQICNWHPRVWKSPKSYIYTLLHSLVMKDIADIVFTCVLKYSEFTLLYAEYKIDAVQYYLS
jgi:hypothetical protein